VKYELEKLLCRLGASHATRRPLEAKGIPDLV
jgi:hypothetical protein